MEFDELGQTWRKLERRLREPRVVEVLARPELVIDTKGIVWLGETLAKMYLAK